MYLLFRPSVIHDKQLLANFQFPKMHQPVLYQLYCLCIDVLMLSLDS